MGLCQDTLHRELPPFLSNSLLKSHIQIFFCLFLSGMFCCGQEYVNKSDTICCSGSSGESLAHVRKNDQVPVKCCETELIPKSEECCNGVGYNPLKYVCSDKISAGMMMKVIDRKSLGSSDLMMEREIHCS